MRVFSNLAISLDGKIADARTPKKALGTPLDRKTMDVIRLGADVVVVGAGTLRAHPQVAFARTGTKTGYRKPANAVVTASGDLDPSWPFWDAPDVVRFVFTTEKGYARAVEAARDRAFVVKAGAAGRVEPARILERLKASRLENVLVEGGGELMAEFCRDRLLQELYVTLTPWILGGRDNPTLVGGTGLESWLPLKLVKSKKVKEEIYLHYKVKGARRV
jgi:5-amino-6-(5-phosphoribosylamino)uracil reductase